MKHFEVPRSAERKPLNIVIDGRVRTRKVYVDLYDVSEGGCKIRGRRGFTKVGETVTLRIDGFKTPLGTIAWVEGEYAGVAFDGNLHPAVIDHLCAKRPHR